MSKQKASKPATAGGFVSDEFDADVAPGESGAVSDDGADTDGPETDPRDAEIAALKAENAKLKAATAGFAAAPGGKYKVRLLHAPTAVVQCEPGEHPWDAYKRLTGVISSENSPQIGPAPDDARVGVCGPDGEVPEPKE
jgi:hypothetical protein